MSNGYKDLRAWQIGMEVVEKTYMLAKLLPKDEAWALADQIKRAAVSIPSNVAEGTGRHSRLEFRRFLGIALGSLFELETQILIAIRLKMLSMDEGKPLLRDMDELGKVLRGLIHSQSARIASSHS